MEYNWWPIIVAALVPMAMGFIWYNPKVLGKAWMRSAGITDEKMKNGNMAKIFGLSFLLSFMIAFFLPTVVIHQMAFFGLMNDAMMSADPTIKDAATKQIENFQSNFGGLYRTFGHGFLHGLILAIFVVLPVMAVNALFERKSATYIFLNWGYWALSIAIMGGIICQWG